MGGKLLEDKRKIELKEKKEFDLGLKTRTGNRGQHGGWDKKFSRFVIKAGEELTEWNKETSKENVNNLL